GGELMKRGLAGTRLDLLSQEKAGEVVSSLEGDRLAQLVRILGELEDVLLVHERRGLSLATLFQRAGSAGLPRYRVILAGKEHWFHSSAEVDEFRRKEQERLGRELVVADESPADHAAGNGHANGHGETIFEQELHEVRGIDSGVKKLRDLGLEPTALLEALRLAGREPLPRFLLVNGDVQRNLPHLRALAPEIRRLGERGLTVTRFKGLGEMEPEELWETTLDPSKRILLRVQMDEASKADDMFRCLMGEKVEPRRDFIQKHALEVKDIDYHGA